MDSNHKPNQILAEWDSVTASARRPATAPAAAGRPACCPDWASRRAVSWPRRSRLRSSGSAATRQVSASTRHDSQPERADRRPERPGRGAQRTSRGADRAPGRLEGAGRRTLRTRGACRPRHVLGRGGGQPDGGVALTNDGDKACTLTSMARPLLIDGHGAVLAQGSLDTKPGATIEVQPGAGLTTLVQVSNVCTAAVPPVTIAFDLGGDRRLVATPLSPTDATVPPCNGPRDAGRDPDAAVGAVTPRTARRRSSLRRRLAPLALAAAVILPVVAAAPGTATAAGPTLAQLVGQKLVVRMDGTTPSADLLGRIRRGEVGGVILFGANITTKAALIALTRELQHAAAAGGQPPLLIAVDQEGGSIKRIPWAPPTMSPPAMGADVALGRPLPGPATGAALKALGINIDLAPVADVPASTSSFMYRQGRTWSFSATQTTLLATPSPPASRRAASPGDEALPGPRLRDAEHGPQRRDDPRVGGRPVAGAPAVPNRDPPGATADDALERDVRRLGPGRGRGLVAGDQHDAAPGDARVPRGRRSRTPSTGPPPRAATRPAISPTAPRKPARTSSWSPARRRRPAATTPCSSPQPGPAQLSTTSLRASYDRILALKARW